MPYRTGVLVLHVCFPSPITSPCVNELRNPSGREMRAECTVTHREIRGKGNAMNRPTPSFQRLVVNAHLAASLSSCLHRLVSLRLGTDVGNECIEANTITEWRDH